MLYHRFFIVTNSILKNDILHFNIAIYFKIVYNYRNKYVKIKNISYD